MLCRHSDVHISHSDRKRAPAHAGRAKRAQKIISNVVISTLQTQTAISGDESCPVLVNDSSVTDTHKSSRLRCNPLSSLYFFHEQGAIFKLLTRGSFHESGDDLVSTERGLDITETDNTDA